MTKSNRLDWTRDEIREHLISTVANALIYYTDHAQVAHYARGQLHRELTDVATKWADAHHEKVDHLIDRHGEYVSDLADDSDLLLTVIDYVTAELGVAYLRRTRPPLYAQWQGNDQDDIDA